MPVQPLIWPQNLAHPTIPKCADIDQPLIRLKFVIIERP